ncbi:MAG: hypothetical protein HY910_12795 [Desulfarculus sp.]|nr:hypothetical protein [Desulfarculus sp.]
MTPEPSDRPQSPGGDDFDTTTQLWDRIADDIARQGAPCLETVEALVDEACHRPPRPQEPQSQQD